MAAAHPDQALRWESLVLNLGHAVHGQRLRVRGALGPGLEATIDGAPAPLVRAHGLVLGLDVPSGKHRVAVRYAPPGLLRGVAASAATAVVIAGLALSETWRRRAAA